MAADYDPTEFVDGDYQSSRSPRSTTPSPAGPQRAPSREEVGSQVLEAQQKLAELKRAQEELERERASLEETRRRLTELQTGREEIIGCLTRGLGLLQEAEFTARREADQMHKTITDFQDALNKVQAINQEAWTHEVFQVELTRALTTVENARMEWNSARLKFPVLAGQTPATGEAAAAPDRAASALLDTHSFGDLCRIGFALTWPVAAVGLIAIGVLVLMFLRR